MKISKGVRRFFFIAFCIFTFWCIIFACRYWYISTHSDEKQSAQSGKETGVKVEIGDSLSLPQYWKFHNGDDSLWANPSFDDSKWDTINPELNLDSIPGNKFSDICWFRTKIQIDSSLINKVLGIQVSHNGASEFYLDGKFLSGFGKVSANKDTEENYLPGLAPVLFTVHEKGHHSMAIRYSNHSFKKYHSVYNEEIAGISLSFLPHPESNIAEIEKRGHYIFCITLLFGFFITLSIVHFLLFIFYRLQKQNLHYSLFTFLFSLSFLALYIALSTNNPVFFLFVKHYSLAGVHLFLLSLISLLYVLFKPSGAKTTFSIAVFLAFLPLAIMYFRLTFISDIISLGTFISIYVIFALVEFIRSVLYALIKKIQGAQIIGTGVLFFALFLLSLILTGIVTGKLNLNVTGDTGIIFIVLLLASIVSIPLSMSIYLARDFARTNKNLVRKLVEVEDLSAKSIAQEKEKQEILSRQKENMEIQVVERTREVVQQKKVIEEKNKDITDSINYAKRIQDAILPSEEQIKKMLPECFVLFKPKDIVSGDFYFFEEVNGKVIASAVDCTGHGVPGAVMSMVGHNHLKRIVSEQGTTDTSKILDELHRQVLLSLNRDISKRDSKDGMDVAIVSIDKQKREVQFSGAVRPLYYFVNARLPSMGKNEIWQGNFNEIKGERYSIAGVKEIGSAPYASTTIAVSESSTFYLFSDGFADQFGGNEGKKLMSKNFRELLASIQNKTMSEQKAFLENFIEEWKGKGEQMDDIMVIGIKI